MLHKVIISLKVNLSHRASQVVQWVKNPPANAGGTRDVCSIPGSGRSPGEGNGNLLQYYRLGNPRDRGGWQAMVHGLIEELDTTWLLNTTTLFLMLISK